MLNEIIEFREHGQVVSAVVLTPGERMRVLTEHGREMNLPAGRVVHRTGLTLATNQAHEALVGQLQAHGLRAEQGGSAIDLDALWDSTADLGKVCSLEVLAGQALQDSGAEARSSVLRALAADPRLFRQARGGFVPRNRAEVEQAQLEEQRRGKEETRRQSFGEWLAAAMAAGRPGTPPEGAQDYIERLAAYAASGPEGKPTLELDLLARAGQPPEQATPDRVFRLLVTAGVLSEDENLLLRKLERRIEFPAEVTRAAEETARSGFGDEGRQPVAENPAIISVDDADTLEIDDAIQLLGRRDDGGWRVAVYIADPDAMVQAGGAVDEEAALRGSTLYLPDRRVPMLPPQIGDEAASLIAGQPRPALGFTLSIDADGEVVEARIDTVTVTIGRRLTFEAVEALLADGDPEINELLACADALREHRFRAGAYLLNQPDMMPRVDATGRISLKRYVSSSPSGRLVAELMVAANRAAADLCHAQRVAAPFRSQFGSGKAPAPPEPGFAYDPLRLQQILNALGRSEVGLEAKHHRGLGVERYMQVTSPLRRYTDLLGHRQLKAALAGTDPPYSPETLLARVRESERLAGECRRIEAWARGYYLFKYLAERVGERCTGVVLRRIDDRVAIELQEFAFRTTFNPRRKVFAGEKLTLEVRSADPRGGKLDLKEIRD